MVIYMYILKQFNILKLDYYCLENAIIQGFEINEMCILVWFWV